MNVYGCASTLRSNHGTASPCMRVSVPSETGYNTVWFGSHSSFKEKKAYLKKDASTNGALTE